MARHRRLGGAATAVTALLGLGSPALGLDPRPTTYRERLKHDFRDVQLGLAHPAPDGRSTPVSPPATQDHRSRRPTTAPGIPATPITKGTP